LVLARFVLEFFFALPGNDLHHGDGIADHVGWALLAFRSSWDRLSMLVPGECPTALDTGFQHSRIDGWIVPTREVVQSSPKGFNELVVTRSSSFAPSE
jgi:hypothetical protein